MFDRLEKVNGCDTGKGSVLASGLYLDVGIFA